VIDRIWHWRWACGAAAAPGWDRDPDARHPFDELHLTDVGTSIEGLSAAGPSARTLRDPGGSNLRASVNVTVPVRRDFWL
jgi:hypothetical protein